MTLPWSKLPRSLAGDARWLLLSPEAACAFAAAWLLADDAGALWAVGDRDAAGTLADLVAPRRPGPAAWARAAVAECLAAGLLQVTADGAALQVADWLDGGAPVAPAADRRSPAAPTAPQAPAAPGGRESRGMTSTERGDLRRFNLRIGRYATVPAGVTYADRHTYATAPATDATVDATVDATDGNGRNGNGNGEATATATVGNGSRAVSETSVLTVEDGEKREEKREQKRASGRCDNGLDNGGNGLEATDATATAVAQREAVAVVEPAPLDPAARAVFDAIAGDKVFRRVRNVGDLAQRLAVTYPDVDVVREIRKAALWAVAKKRPVRSGTFLTTWMSNADPAPAGDPMRSGVYLAPDADDDANDPWAKGLAALPPLPPREAARG
jgi:hypothetical protein